MGTAYEQDRRRPALNERPVPNEQLFDPLPRYAAPYSNQSQLPKPVSTTTSATTLTTTSSFRSSNPPSSLPSSVSSTAASDSTHPQISLPLPKQPTPISTASPAESAASAKMTQHSMSIPERISTRGGTISDFMAEVVALQWFESTKLLDKVESMPTIHRGAALQPLSPTAIASQHLKKWLSGVLTTTQVTQNVVILALLYIYRLKKANPTVKGRPGSEYRLLTVALMLGNKFLDDNTYTNKTWADVSAIGVNEIHVMEVEFLSNMRYSLLVSAEEWEQWLDKLSKFWSYLELVQKAASPVPAPSPLLVPSPTYRNYASPLHSPIGPATPVVQSASQSFILRSPNLAPMVANNNGQNWPAAYVASNATSPLAAKPQPYLQRKRSFPEAGDATEHPAKRMHRLPAGPAALSSQAPTHYAVAAPQPHLGLPHPTAPVPVASRLTSGVVSDQTRQHVPSLTLNTAQATEAPVTQAQAYAASAYAAAQAPLSLPPLASGVRAMSMVFPTTTYTPPQSIPAPSGAMTPTASFPPMSYGTPTKRLSPQSSLAAYPGSSPLVVGNGTTSGLHTPISNSPSIYLQQRNSPYKPVRHVNTLLYPPPSAFLQQYQLPNPVLPNQMHYQPLGKRNEYRTGIVPDFLDSDHRIAGYALPASSQARSAYQPPAPVRSGAPYLRQY
ncbi:uncharacterized protein C8A04DRAFT_40347 [Dichotomopilus funicola]|uniref:Uncharacterized protein n=1 Tax=Dichotomopilus funicola TaxID=1934379 RepID=A0AAN6UVV1_9PEZI|nr:hypothetical protein C8A04DRAFT_40347 [Dichotomopilus funicola]